MCHGGLVNQILDLTYRLLQRLRLLCRLHQRIIILMNLRLTILHQHIMTCRKLIDSFEKGLGKYGILE